MTTAAPTDLDEPPPGTPRFLRAFWRLVRWALPTQFRYFGLYEYRIATVYAGPYLDLQATGDTVAVGLDDIPKTQAWCGLPGSAPVPVAGSRVLVMFVNGNAARPIVALWAPPGDPGWVPTQVSLGGPGAGSLLMTTPFLSWALEVENGLAGAGHPVSTPISASAGTSKVIAS